MTWFDKKFNSEKWWEHRLKLVAKEFGLELSLYSFILAHNGYVRKTYGNWRCSPMWFRHLDSVARSGIDVGA